MRNAAQKRDWTKGSIFRNLLSLSWPIVISSTSNILGPVIDMIWVGKLGAAAIAGVGISSMAVVLLTSARMGLTQGTRAMVARFVGADDPQGANHVAQQAFVISAAYVIVVSSIGIFLAETILRLFGLEADVIHEGATYMRIMFAGSITMSFRMMAEGIMQASGDTVTPMIITVCFRVLHVILCPFLVFGWWIFPSLGVSGAAVTNVFAQGVGCSIGLWILFSGRSRLRLSLKGFHFDGGIIKRIVKIGIPASIMAMERSFGNLVLVGLISPFGTLAVACHALIERMEAILRMPSMGLGQGAAVLVGQNLGAGQPGRSARSGWIAAGLAQGFALIIVLVVMLWAENIVRVFNAEPDVVVLTSSFLRIAAVGYLMMGLYYVLQNSILGSGDTLPPMLVTLLNFWMVQVPLAFVLTRLTGLEVYGVRWAVAIGMITGAVAYMTYFHLGRWKSKKI